ncbi:MAG: FtsQ-type POTRA domain-containing protein [Clostridia bacterium]|nr:FtsQ-type POTRA domain-containing protein [Clostridia bacterium]
MDNITKGDFRKVARKKRKKRTGKGLLIIIAIMLIIFLSPLFKIKEITVEGTDKLSHEYIISASGLTTGKHLVFSGLSKAEDILNKTAYISGAKISYHFPSSLVISVEEKMPVVYYSFADGFVGINSDGVVTDIVQDMDTPLPVAEGITLASYSIGEKPDVDESSDMQISCLIEVASEIYNQKLSDEIKYINVSKISDIILKTNNGLMVKCGNTEELSYKLSMLKEVISVADTAGVVDISTPSRVTYEVT